ncbi:class B sortase [Clostridium vincentii]|uniref:Sortase family protein n=1 Tax=Clostridium vincentii TaxID=52704 RepID=A0A2T0BLE1_9CLOT|nr:class B sortase [Clostridium vincentii]PRR84653.1 Sortase family protein [Clostridium vincentii]
MNEKVSKKEILRRVVVCISLIVFIVCGYKLYNIWSEYNKNSEVYEETKEFSPEKIALENGEERYEFKAENYNNLLSINPDFKSWISINDTEINYPVVKTDNNELYLTHNFKKEENAGGAIFISTNNIEPFSDKNTILHGHHMKDGSMFADLEKYKDESFAKEHPIYISTRDKVLKYDVFTVFIEKADNGSYQNSFASNDEYVNYINKLKGKSLFNIEAGNFTQDDKIITLSTCDYDVDDGRLIVCGRLVSSLDY